MLPPVDVQANAPGAVDPQPFRDKHGLSNDETVFVTCSTPHGLDESGKPATDDSRGGRAQEPEAAVRDRWRWTGARAVRGLFGAKGQHRRRPRSRDVHWTGETDPRPGYAGADIIVGQGGSALRGMAFGKPVLVVAERNYAELFNHDTRDDFYYRGIYGLGDGSQDNRPLVARMELLAKYPDLAVALHSLGREFVVQNFGLEAVTWHLNKYLNEAVSTSLTPYRRAIGIMRTAAILVGRRVADTGADSVADVPAAGSEVNPIINPRLDWFGLKEIAHALN